MENGAVGHFVYILRAANDKFYVGYTTDVERRMRQHRTGKGSKFVRGFGFDSLLYREEWATKSKALQREAQIKRWPRAKKEELIASFQGD